MPTRSGKVALITVLVAVVPGAFAGSRPALKSSTVAVQLRAVVQERLSLVSATQGVVFSLSPERVARGDRPISFTTSWNLDATRTSVVVSAFFEDATGALTALGSTNPADRVATADVWGRSTTGTPTEFAPFSSAVRWPGCGMEVFRQQLRPHVNDMFSRTDELELEIDLTRRASLPLGSYEGELTLVAEAY